MEHPNKGIFLYFLRNFYFRINHSCQPNSLPCQGVSCVRGRKVSTYCSCSCSCSCSCPGEACSHASPEEHPGRRGNHLVLPPSPLRLLAGAAGAAGLPLLVQVLQQDSSRRRWSISKTRSKRSRRIGSRRSFHSPSFLPGIACWRVRPEMKVTIGGEQSGTSWTA